MVKPIQEANQETMNELYRNRLETKGTLYTTQNSQQLRFASLLANIDFKGKTVLDVGCGLGDLVDFLDKNGQRPKSYLGLDILPECVEKAVKQHIGAGNLAEQNSDKLEVVFGVCPDFLDDKFHAEKLGQYDIVVGVGLLELKFENNPVGNFSKAMLMFDRMVERSELCTIATFLSPCMSDAPLPEEAPISAGSVYEYIKRGVANPGCLHSRCIIDHSYAPHVYTATVIKGQSPWEKNYLQRKAKVAYSPAPEEKAVEN